MSRYPASFEVDLETVHFPVLIQIRDHRDLDFRAEYRTTLGELLDRATRYAAPPPPSRLVMGTAFYEACSALARVILHPDPLGPAHKQPKVTPGADDPATPDEEGGFDPNLAGAWQNASPWTL